LAGGFVAAALVVAWAGVRLTTEADALAERTRLGGAVFGAAFLGATTSLPGIVTSVGAAAMGYPKLAVSNAVGGIAAQTVFIAFADMFYRRANLEHAAASAPNLVNGALISTLLGWVLLSGQIPQWTVLSVHPASVVLILGYVGGLYMARDAQRHPMWAPSEMPKQRRKVVPASEEQVPIGRVWLKFAVYGLIVAGAGYAVSRLSTSLVRQTGISETIVGTYLSAITTSLPELVTAIAAVRRGALALAVGDILGGNVFDVLFVAFSDIAYRAGSIYAHVTDDIQLVLSLAIVLTGVALLGLLRRERSGVANIGFEGVLVILLYAGTIVALTMG
jgi:cation:H+ antiporter